MLHELYRLFMNFFIDFEIIYIFSITIIFYIYNSFLNKKAA
uniref:Uncharacterized protein n=1 Tax=Bostrychia moritziana TaxID=103713 RepID=A0A1Z1M6X9_BOSMO|nr:hypothetical protein [Bostrychia moritziana]ARW61749.1 hypothetical protein [Bostrychia moritziana]